jgi:hypothetical protein
MTGTSSRQREAGFRRPAAALCGSGVGRTAGQSKAARIIAAEAFSRLDMDVVDIVDNVSVANLFLEV